VPRSPLESSAGVCCAAHLECDAGGSCCLKGWHILGRVLQVHQEQADRQCATHGCALPGVAHKEATLLSCLSYCLNSTCCTQHPVGNVQARERQDRSRPCHRLHTHRHRKVAVQVYAAVLAQCSHHRGSYGEVGGKGACSRAPAQDGSACCKSHVGGSCHRRSVLAEDTATSPTWLAGCLGTHDGMRLC
jgi:hypothetical protein